MAISPPSDIVLDVLRAADPAQAAAAQARLAALRPARIAESFEVAPPPNPTASGAVRTARSGDTPEAYQKFEAMVLQSFLQSMMPEDSESVYGGGLAGDMWRSMLAEQIAGVMAKNGGIGIADRVMGDYTMSRDKKVALTDVTTEAVNTQRGENGLLSTALIDEMQRRLLQSIREDAGLQTGTTTTKP